MAAEASSPRPQERPPGRVTPMMRQYLSLKAENPDAVLLFRMGDFYETFYDDAVLVSSILGLTLTSREKQGDDPIPLAGIPHHALDHYLARLVQHGCTVAICEQTEDPAQAKGLVRREVVEVVSPGTITHPALLTDDQGVHLLALAPDGSTWGWALLDGATGAFRCGGGEEDDVLSLCRRYPVGEILLPASIADRRDEDQWRAESGVEAITFVDDRGFRPAVAERTLCDHFGLEGIEGLGLRAEDAAARAAGAALAYLRDRQRTRPAQVRTLEVERPGRTLHLDRETVAHLELFEGLRAGERETSLFHHLDRCVSAMGRRRLAAWLRSPLCELRPIEERLDTVEWLTAHATRLQAFREGLRGIGDLERVTGRVATGRASPHEMGTLRDGLRRLPGLARTLGEEVPERLRPFVASAPSLGDLGDELGRALVETPPTHLRQGGVFAEGYDETLDRLRALHRDGKGWIAAYQEKERTRTGIPNLKVGYNKVFGYYLEVTNKHLSSVPEDYLEKQRLAGGKRYVTGELKEREQSILRAQDEQIERERVLFRELLAAWSEHLEVLGQGLRALADADAHAALATLARERRWVRPVLDDGDALDVYEGRHPVVEELSREPFVPNDLHLDRARRQVILLTGPNMGGKSTYLRQAALVVVLAQMGSFVPAERARIGLVDRLFTRVGASDNLARGQSTFLVEMAETAKILRGATARSLVVFDEVGRGTSTRDGLALARAIVEYLHDGPIRPRTLFATHFHELTALERDHPRLVNARMEVREWEGRILFLHRVVDGAADRSYGLHVAELAGVPEPVVRRARALLEEADAEAAVTAGPPPAPVDPVLPLFAAAADPLRARLAALHPEELTPLQALNLLAELVAEARASR